MHDERIYPYLLEPQLRELIWGGDALVAHYGKEGDPRAKYGESWECWDTNRVVNGAASGETVADLRTMLGRELLGSLDPHRTFPVLTKIIDARDSLSVQVHPDDAYASAHEHQPNGKTECWYILAAEPGAHLILGWNRDTDAEEYRRRVADGSLTELLRRVPVKPGDVFYLPAGTLHAIGAGVQLFETQQASDLTYRIFDWHRVDSSGRPRELHVEKAADVLDYRRSSAGAIKPLEYVCDGFARTALIADPRFVVERIEVTSDDGALAMHDMPLVVMPLNGTITLSDSVGLKAYQTALVPAALGSLHLTAHTDPIDVLVVSIPEDTGAFARHLNDVGLEGAAVEEFLAQFAAAGL